MFSEEADGRGSEGQQVTPQPPSLDLPRSFIAASENRGKRCRSRHQLVGTVWPGRTSSDLAVLWSCGRTAVQGGSCMALTSGAMLDVCGMQRRKILIAWRRCWRSSANCPSCGSASAAIFREDLGRSFTSTRMLATSMSMRGSAATSNACGSPVTTNRPISSHACEKRWHR
jgi:hypothetical protein